MSIDDDIEEIRNGRGIYQVTKEDGENIKNDFLNNVCYQCGIKANYLFADGRCKYCTRMSLDEVKGEGA